MNMAPEDVEAVIKELAVDTELREDFFIDPDAVLEEYGLTVTEKEKILSSIEGTINPILIDEDSETWLVAG